MQTFEEMFAQEYDRAYRLALQLTRDPHLAEDITADVFTKVLARWEHITEDAGAYVRRAIVNTANSWFRRQGTRRSYAHLWEREEAADVIRIDEHVADVDLVSAAMSRLPDRQRDVLVLRYYEDRSEQEIATTLGISRGAVKSSASRALDRLRRAPGLAPAA